MSPLEIALPRYADSRWGAEGRTAQADSETQLRKRGQNGSLAAEVLTAEAEIAAPHFGLVRGAFDAA